MLKNYLKIALRFLKKQKLYSVLHIFSLTLGISSAFLIYMYIQNETSYDDFQKKGDHIVRLTRWFNPDGKNVNHFARCPQAWQPWVKALKDEYPEIKNIARLTRKRGIVLQIGEKKFTEDYFFITDKEVFDVLTIPLIAGNKRTALNDPFSIIINKSTAALYPHSNAMGKILHVIDDQGNKKTYKITGIMKDWNEHSHLQIDFLASNPVQNLQQEWAFMYLLLDSHTDPKKLENKFPDFVKRHFGEQAAENSAFYLQRLKDIHLHSHLDREIKVNGDITTVYVLWIVAFFIILITCINYINLSTAQAVKRSKEIGIRRIIGSGKSQLTAQFLTEAVLITSIAAICSYAFIKLVLPQLNNLIGKSLEFHITDEKFILFIGFVLSIGLLSGIYPALAVARLSSLNATLSKGYNSYHPHKLSFRNLLITLQFGISAFLLICSFVLKDQLKYIIEKPLGFNKEQVISVDSKIPQNTHANYQLLRNRMIENPNIINMSACMQEPSDEVKDLGASSVGSIREGNDRAYLYILCVDEHFIKLMGIKMICGKNFLPSAVNYGVINNYNNFLTDLNSMPRSYILNETALKQIGFHSAQEAIGKQMDWNCDILHFQKGPIVGVVKDFNFSTLQKKIKPFVLVIEPRFLSSILIKIKPENMAETIGNIKKTWDQMFPENPFEYHFLDDLFAKLYENDQQLKNVVTLFAWIAIIIACLGLFGLVMHNAEERTKEIGVRKVLGASIISIFRMLARQYIRWIVIAEIVVCPVAYYVMNKWLQNFAYRINLTVYPFLLASFFVLMIALLTVSYQAIKAATANPIESLRYE